LPHAAYMKGDQIITSKSTKMQVNVNTREHSFVYHRNQFVTYFSVLFLARQSVVTQGLSSNAPAGVKNMCIASASHPYVRHAQTVKDDLRVEESVSF